MDYLTAAVSELGNIAERRIEQLVNPVFSQAPAFLVKDKGVNSGFMIVQVAAASLVSESKTLSFPASVDSIPTSAGKEDHVSMGTIAARKCAQVTENTACVSALEVLTACQALDFRAVEDRGCSSKRPQGSASSRTLPGPRRFPRSRLREGPGDGVGAREGGRKISRGV